MTPLPKGPIGSSKKSLNSSFKSRFEFLPETSKLPSAENVSFLSSFKDIFTS